MAKAMEKYYSEYYDPQKKKADNSLAQRQQQDTELIAAYNESADTAANTAAGKYRQSIDALPGQSQALYDQNAVTEAFNRKKIQERLANMGATNSGLNSSMQTALAVQKGNADRQVALQEQEARTQLLQAIDDMYAQTELAKKDYATSTHQATADWYRNLLTQIDATATQAASTAYAADVEYDAQLAAANLQKEADIETARIKAETERQNGFEDLVLAMYKQNEDGDMDRAMAQAVQLGYSTGNKDTDAQLLAYLDGINSGYGRGYSEVYAGAGGGEAGQIAVIMAEIAAAGVDTATLTDMTTLEKWSPNRAMRDIFGLFTDNTPTVETLAKRARTNVAQKGLSETTAECAAAHAVGSELRSRATAENADEIGKSLETQFSGIALTIALQAAGIEEEK